MPQPERSAKLQHAVLWEAGGVLDEFARPSTAAPVQLCLRWEWRRGEMTGPDNGVVVTDAEVICDRHVAVGSVMWPGRLSDLPAGTASPAAPGADLYRVVSCDSIPDVRQRLFEYELKLARHSDTLPART